MTEIQACSCGSKEHPKFPVVYVAGRASIQKLECIGCGLVVQIASMRYESSKIIKAWNTAMESRK